MYKWVAGVRIYVVHLFSIMLSVASAPLVYLVPSAHFLPSISLMYLAFFHLSAPSTLSMSSALPVFSVLPASSTLSVPLLYTNLASIYHHRECCLLACPTILEPSH